MPKERVNMPPRLKQYINRSILVSIPALFEDGKCRDYILQSVEADGLWLSSNALAERLLTEGGRTAQRVPLVFVPAAQISAIILPRPAAPMAQPGDAGATPAETGAAATVAAAKVRVRGRAKAGAPGQAAQPPEATATPT
jgi:hypothetical protein